GAGDCIPILIWAAIHRLWPMIGMTNNYTVRNATRTYVPLGAPQLKSKPFSSGLALQVELAKAGRGRRGRCPPTCALLTILPGTYGVYVGIMEKNREQTDRSLRTERTDTDKAVLDMKVAAQLADKVV